MFIRIGIIGAGNVARALTKVSVRAGYTVAITATDAEAGGHVAEVGDTAAASNAEAVAGADIVILAVPFAAVNAIIHKLGAGLDG
jgi:prephenate dehydrogenase